MADISPAGDHFTSTPARDDRDHQCHDARNDDNIYMLKTRLELLGGFEVLAAGDSETGCELAVTEHPDVILSGPRNAGR
jgi:hypothetical protein